MVADGWKRQAQLDGTDVTAAVTRVSLRTQLEMAVGFLQSRNGGRLPPDYPNWSDDEVIAHAMLEKEFNPQPKDVINTVEPTATHPGECLGTETWLGLGEGGGWWRDGDEWRA